MDGRIVITVHADGVIESRGEGAMTCAQIAEWVAGIRVVRATQPVPARMLFDALAVDGWESGCAAIALRSAREHAGRTAAAAFVTRSPSLVRIGALLLRMMPSAPRAVFATRGEGLAFLAGYAERARVAERHRAL